MQKILVAFHPMETHEKAEIKLRWGLALKNILDANKAVNDSRKGKVEKKDELIGTIGKLYTYSGISKATLINICKGRKNAEETTWTAILTALGMSLAQFGAYYDDISDGDLKKYKLAVESENKRQAVLRNPPKKKK